MPPPPLPEPLHWSIVALVVLPFGRHKTVGSVPPPVPDPLHWLTVAGVGDAAPVMLLMTCTLQVTVPPPPLPEPSHCLTWVTSWVDGVVVVVHGRAALAAPWHSLTVTVELVIPVAWLRLLATVTSHATAWPPTLSLPLHWSTAGSASAADLVAIGAAAIGTAAGVEMTEVVPTSGAAMLPTGMVPAAAVWPTLAFTAAILRAMVVARAGLRAAVGSTIGGAAVAIPATGAGTLGGADVWGADEGAATAGGVIVTGWVAMDDGTLNGAAGTNGGFTATPVGTALVTGVTKAVIAGGGIGGGPVLRCRGIGPGKVPAAGATTVWLCPSAVSCRAPQANTNNSAMSSAPATTAPRGTVGVERMRRDVAANSGVVMGLLR